MCWWICSSIDFTEAGDDTDDTMSWSHKFMLFQERDTFGLKLVGWNFFVSCFYCIVVFEQLSKWVLYKGGLIEKCMYLDGRFLTLLMLNEDFKSILCIRQAFRKSVCAKVYTRYIEKWSSNFVRKTCYETTWTTYTLILDSITWSH